MRLTQFLTEKMTQGQLNDLEYTLDKLFKSLNIDIEFTKHFIKRVNDKRNGKEINFKELQDIFTKTYKKYAKSFQQLPDNTEAVLNDLQSKLNVPFVLKVNMKSHMIDLISKTVMRKKDFKTSNKKYRV